MRWGSILHYGAERELTRAERRELVAQARHERYKCAQDAMARTFCDLFGDLLPRFAADRITVEFRPRTTPDGNWGRDGRVVFRRQPAPGELVRFLEIEISHSPHSPCGPGWRMPGIEAYHPYDEFELIDALYARLYTLREQEQARRACGEVSVDTEGGLAWWNSMTEQSRKTMLESPMVRDDPTPARCWEVFGQSKDQLAAQRRR